jgi:exoribonuclease-2
MIAANGVTARFLEARGFPVFRRVVRSPERWDRIRAVAAESGDALPAAPDSRALAAFLTRRRQAAPDRFADLSHTIIRLLGSGEYVADGGRVSGHGVETRPPSPGHFGLAVRDYTHSTAPNRRYPDLITQRLVKAALAGRPCPYGIDELEGLAAHCTRQEDAANKVERQVRKSAEAMVIAGRVGERFDAIVTGASRKGTWVRVAVPPIEGKVVRGERGLDVGDRVRVELVDADVERGYIDFVAVG